MSIFLVFSFASQAGLTLPGPFWDLALIFIRSTGLDMYGSLHPALDRIMHIQPYLPGVTTRQLDTEACVGCGMCESVCPHTPHTVFQMKGKKAAIEDLDGCMECGACAQNCPTNAIRVTPGVGCASYIIQTWIKGKETASCSGVNCC